MATYVIGDVQGCRAALEDLLDRIRFDPASDRLFFAGDLVARGPDSLGTLRLIHGLGPVADSVLGNHDLHLLAVSHRLAPVKDKDRTLPVLMADDREPLLDWLRRRPLLIELPGHVLTHAGLPPGWSPAEARARAREVEAALQGGDSERYLAAMYGNTPACWDDQLSGLDRLRVITNHFTRMRLLHDDGSLDFAHKEALDTAPPGLHAWFTRPNPARGDTRMVFGHWAALQGHTGVDHAIAVDTGCVWGNTLCAWRLEDGQRFHSRPGLQ